eukprot:sb/3472966/
MVSGRPDEWQVTYSTYPPTMMHNWEQLTTLRKPLNPTNFDALNHISNFSSPSGIGKVAMRLGQNLAHMGKILPYMTKILTNYASDIIGVCVFVCVCVCVCVRVCMLPGRVDLFVAPEYIESAAFGARALPQGNVPRVFSRDCLKVRVFRVLEFVREVL